MTVIVYQCDTCDRVIEKTQNRNGLEFIGRCVITNQCKGTLYKTGTRPFTVARHYPEPVTGLNDWKQRRLMHTHDQTALAATWLVTHNLETHPSIQVFERTVLNQLTGETVLTEIEPNRVEYINANVIKLFFNSTKQGIVQCLSRDATTAKTQVQQSIVSRAAFSDITRLSVDQVLTIGVKNKAPSIDVDIRYLSGKDLSEFTGITPLTFVPVTTDSLWHNITPRVYVNGTIYHTYSAVLPLSTLVDRGLDDGTVFYFNAIDNNPIEVDDGIILLSNAPYNNKADREFDYIVDLRAGTSSTAASVFVFKEQEMYCDTTHKQPVFPRIAIP